MQYNARSTGQIRWGRIILYIIPNLLILWVYEQAFNNLAQSAFFLVMSSITAALINEKLK